MTDARAPRDRAAVLVADDQPDVLDAVRLLLHPEGFATELVQSPAGLLQALERRQFDLLLMDLNYARDTTSGREGLDLLSQVHAHDADLPIVVMTGWGTMEIAVEALQQGVRDFVQKPWDNERLLATVRKLSGERRSGRARALRRARELEHAREIQRGLLPRVLPAVPGWDVAAACEEAEGVGGDTYDVCAVDDRRIAFSIADVAGKGIPAALLATNLQAAVRSAVAEHPEPADLCHRVNRILCAMVPPDRFVTFFYGLLDTADGTLRYCNAGHNPPLLVRADGTAGWLQAGGRVFGFDPASTYTESATALAPGDRLVLYTDGVVEARNASGEEFGEDRLASAAADGGGHAAGLLAHVLADLGAFAGERREDDRTVVVVRRNSAAGASAPSPTSVAAPPPSRRRGG
jgi:sigma-B regulation protein RsbU (phosphoserine phosphatase)